MGTVVKSLPPPNLTGLGNVDRGPGYQTTGPVVPKLDAHLGP